MSLIRCGAVKGDVPFFAFYNLEFYRPSNNTISVPNGKIPNIVLNGQYKRINITGQIQATYTLNLFKADGTSTSVTGSTFNNIDCTDVVLAAFTGGAALPALTVTVS